MNPGKIKRIAFVTVGRSDFGIVTPVIHALLADGRFEPSLLVTGAHYSGYFGRTVDAVRDEGIPILAEAPVTYSVDDTGMNMSGVMAQVLQGATDSIAGLEAGKVPDIVFLMGDRFEMMAAACAFAPMNIALAHLHGGELSFGAVDDAMRHAITKLSHLHFVSTREAAKRVRQMGEQDWRITVSGAPALDRVNISRRSDAAALASSIGLEAIEITPPVVVTVHPETRGANSSRILIDAVLSALEETEDPIVFTHPNADPGHQEIVRRIAGFCRARKNAAQVENLGVDRFFDLMSIAGVMIGNSSSGIVEAPSFGLPVVNIGDRQRGRTRGANVFDCKAAASDISAAIAAATRPGVRERVGKSENPYGDGQASKRIVARLSEITLDARLLTKEFVDR